MSSAVPAPRPHQIERPEGSVHYRRSDLTPADDLYRPLPEGAHLHRALAGAGPVIP